MSATTTLNQTLQTRRPNSTHLESLLVTDFYGVNSENENFMHGSPSPTNTQIDLTNDSSTSISHKRERSLPVGNCARLDFTEASQPPKDDVQIYANVAEIERQRQADFIDRQERPPIPNFGDKPIRVLRNSGWKEYKTIGGRSYFFNDDLGVAQWIPPRAATCKVFNTFGKRSTIVIEPTRKQSFCEDSQNASTLLSTFCGDNQKQNSKPLDQTSSFSTDSTSTESLKYAEPPILISTHVANPLIEKELNLLKAPAKLESLDKTTSFRSPLGSNQIVYCKYMLDEPRSLTAAFPGPSCSTNICMPMTTTFPVLNTEMSASLSSAASSLRSRNYFTPNSAIHQGTLEKCRLPDGWAKVKKNQWEVAYALLYSGHLLFYRDQKSAEKTGKHYPTPLDVCDLRGAKLCHVDIEKFKDKRHKNVISLQLPNNNIYLFSASDNEVQDWYHALKDTILSLPPCPDFLLTEHGSLGRASNKSTKFDSKQSIRQSIKNGLKSANKTKIDTEIPPKESIIDRLLRFLRSRPTIETLSERGIYRSEPVFGSTLTAVCEHDKTSVPRFITEIITVIEKRGLKLDGLYRVSGNLSSIQKLRCQIDQDRYDALNKEEDVHVLTGALKLFLRELSDPIIPFELNKEFISAIKEPQRNRFKIYDDLLKRLPEINRNTLAVLISHLRRVALHSSENRMQIHNLAIVFGPALFHSEGRTTKTHQRRNSGFLSKKQTFNTEPKTMPSQNLAYKMVVFGQITESILNDYEKFEVFAAIPFRLQL